MDRNSINQLTEAEIEAHTKRVIRHHQFTTDELIQRHRAKLARAIRHLGAKWIGHPARRVARATHERRDAIVFGVTMICVPPVMWLDACARGFV